MSIRGKRGNSCPEGHICELFAYLSKNEINNTTENQDRNFEVIK